MSSFGQLLFEQAKANAEQYAQGKPLTVPSEEAIKEALTARADVSEPLIGFLNLNAFEALMNEGKN